MRLVLLLTTIAAAFLILSRVHIRLSKSEDWIVIFVLKKLVLGFRDLDEEIFGRFLQFLNQVVHYIYIDKASQRVVQIVVLLKVIIC